MALWLLPSYRGKHYIVQDEVVDPFSEPCDFEVDPESVGQLAATVKDVDLYEGDYVLHKHTTCDDSVKSSVTTRHVLKFNPKHSNIVLYCIDDRYICKGDSFGVQFIDQTFKTEFGDVRYIEEYKVIGNEYEEKLKISNP